MKTGFAKRSILLIIGGLITFGLIESVARMVLGLGTPPLSVVDPEIEYMFKPNQDVMRFGNRQLYNAYGMRNEVFPRDKPAGEYRIICFGDSVLNGGSLTDHAQLATTRLADLLEREWGRPVMVANTSAGSWGPPNMFAYARKYGLFGADHVVVQVSSHDIGDVPTHAPLSPFTHPTRNPCCATWEGITRYVPKYIPALKPVLRRNSAKANRQDPPPREKLEQKSQDAYDQSLQALSNLYELATAQGAGFIIVLHSERKEIETGVFRPGHDRFAEWARQHSVDLLDLSFAEAESLKKGVDPYRRNSNIHVNDAGQRIIAEQLYDYFCKYPRNAD